ncbi:LytR/AlgR family response regulator transcription factor [Pseudoduganella umbonata]|uniref:Response regulator transcription factor n=1 Tax=Pseudoduganella umbonata TaxID=864828 RepID=A0A4P8HHT9_9BURK|nr:LytTR family DNA-binding domain-containing protein [Pseudoduganella umbonata]MBB3221755.1 two-component system LytT family response regulator [Pseudoduganella umbonata]QCP09027.1 response regulator transcription factor [Pseudoduganella umbonata]
MRLILVDDEPLARGMAREYLATHPDIEIVAECANGFEAVKAVTELAPDLVLLDIQMPKLDGFEVAELVGNKTRIIFATAFDQYAIRAFEIHALDYLLKPFSQERFDGALAHARASLASALPRQQAAVREASATRDRPLGRVLIRDGARVHVVAADKIAWIEAQDDYVQIHADGKAYLKNGTLGELEAQLDAGRFLRIHRSCLVNVEHVARIEPAGRDSHAAILADGTKLPISRSGYQKIRAVMQ